MLALALLGAIAVIAFLSSPMVQHFGPDEVNLWVTRLPFVWLPAVLVTFALAGQIVVVRSLLRPARALSGTAAR